MNIIKIINFKYIRYFKKKIGSEITAIEEIK